MKSNVFTKVTDYIKKVADVETLYNAKAEENHEKLMELETALLEQKKHYEAVHKMYLLDDVTEETYLTAKAEFDEIAEKVQQLKLDIGVIKKYEIQDKEEIIEQVQEIESELSSEIYTIQDKAQRKVLLAKQQYLQKLAEAGAEYKKATSFQVRIVNLKNKVFNQNKTAYVGNAFETLGFIHIGSNIYENAEVSRNEIYEALENGLVKVNLKN